jgi:bifunctional non-homologous end joining protein LigD
MLVERGAPVSAPCTWDEIEADQVHPQSFTLRTMPARLDAVGDLWSGLGARRRRTPGGKDAEAAPAG